MFFLEGISCLQTAFFDGQHSLARGEWWHYSDPERDNYGVVDLNRVLARPHFADAAQTP